MYKVDKINGIVSSYTLGYYLPSKYGVKHPSSEKIHDYLLYTFKDNKINKSNYKWIELAANKCNEKFRDIDIVIRALGSSELKPSTAKDKSINILGKRIAEKLNAHYIPELLSSNRGSKKRAKLHLSGKIENRPAIIDNDKLSFSSGSNKYYNDPGSPRILIIDDIITSGSTAAGIAKAVNATFNSSSGTFFFALGETCSKPFVSEEKLQSSIKRNDRLFNTIETYDPEKIEKETLKVIQIKNQKEKELKLRKEAAKKRIKEQKLKQAAAKQREKERRLKQEAAKKRIKEQKIQQETEKDLLKEEKLKKKETKKFLKGDFVSHGIFGKGIVLKVDTASDRVSVEFYDDVIKYKLRKKLSIKYAGLKKVSRKYFGENLLDFIEREKKRLDTESTKVISKSKKIDLFEPKQKSKKNKSQEEQLQDINRNFKGLKKKFPHLDIEQEFDRMSDWLLYNDKKYKDYEEFFENWLKEEEKIRFNKEIELQLNNLAEYAEQLGVKKGTDELRDLISTYEDENQAKEYLKKEAELQRAKEYALEQRLKKEAEERRQKEEKRIEEKVRRETLKIEKRNKEREEFRKKQKIAEEKRLKKEEEKKKLRAKNLQLKKEERARKIEEKRRAQELKIKKEAARAKKIKDITIATFTTCVLFILFTIALQEPTTNQKKIEESEEEAIIPDFFSEDKKTLEDNKAPNWQAETTYKAPKKEQVSTSESPKKSKPKKKKKESNEKLDNSNTIIPAPKKEIGNCSPNEGKSNNRNAKDRPATLIRNLSNYHAERVSIFDPSIKRDDGVETWNMYLEESQFLKGKFRHHRKVERVVVNCFVDNKGKVIQMEILENSSNNPRHEEEAEKLIYVLDFLPGVKNNQDICMWVPVSVIFSKRR